jgi:hypothetical protein
MSRLKLIAVLLIVIAVAGCGGISQPSSPSNISGNQLERKVMANGSQKSWYSAAVVLNLILRGQSYTPPTTLYAGLKRTTNAVVGPDGTPGVEIFGNMGNLAGYQREPITFGAPTSNGGSPGATISNNTDVQFPVANLDWGSIDFIAIYDAPVGGHCLYWIAVSNIFTGGQAVTRGNSYVIRSGQIVLNEF